MSAVNSPLLSRQRISVQSRGDMVRMSIGNADIDMPYEAAIQLSQWLRVRGKESKRQAGDMSRHWSAVAILDGLKG